MPSSTCRILPEQFPVLNAKSLSSIHDELFMYTAPWACSSEFWFRVSWGIFFFFSCVFFQSLAVSEKTRGLHSISFFFSGWFWCRMAVVGSLVCNHEDCPCFWSAHEPPVFLFINALTLRCSSMLWNVLAIVGYILRTFRLMSSVAFSVWHFLFLGKIYSQLKP